MIYYILYPTYYLFIIRLQKYIFIRYCDLLSSVERSNQTHSTLCAVMLIIKVNIVCTKQGTLCIL